MSRHYGPIFQVAYVVADFEATLRHWTDVMGVGPFYLFPTPIAFSRLRAARRAHDQHGPGGTGGAGVQRGYAD